MRVRGDWPEKNVRDHRSESSILDWDCILPLASNKIDRIKDLTAGLALLKKRLP